MSITDVGLTEIAQAGEKARRLAVRIADLVRSSDVPTAHWDEVGQRVADLLVVHEVHDAGAAIQRVAGITHLHAAEAV